GHDVEVVVTGLDRPHAHIHRLSEARYAYQVVADNLDAEQRGFDAVVVGHFQDGGVHELRAALDIPVVGLGEAALHHAMMLGEALIIPAGGLPALVLQEGEPVDLDGAAVLDPIGVALGQAELWARLRIRPGRRGPYARPSREVLDDFVSPWD